MTVFFGNSDYQKKPKSESIFTNSCYSQLDKVLPWTWKISERLTINSSHRKKKAVINTTKAPLVLSTTGAFSYVFAVSSEVRLQLRSGLWGCTDTRLLAVPDPEHTHCIKQY